MRAFDPARYSSLSAVVVGHLTFLHEFILVPFMMRLQPVISALRSEVRDLQTSFLGRAPVPPSHEGTQDNFYSQSAKRDVPASLRRYSLSGMQSRGLHVRMRQARTKEEHLYFAQLLEHPNTAIGRALEPDWLYVFSFRTKSLPESRGRVVR